MPNFTPSAPGNHRRPTLGALRFATPKSTDPKLLRSIKPTRAGAASSFLVYRYSNGGECGFQFFALPFRHEMSRLGIPADIARQVFHPRCSEKVQIKPENFIGHDA